MTAAAAAGGYTGVSKPITDSLLIFSLGVGTTPARVHN